MDEWTGCYNDGWKGLIVEDAFSHPAKFSNGLIRKIYDHAIEQGWVRAGDSVVDPFGGVALGGYFALIHGLNWVGCELEFKFVDLGIRNISRWYMRLKDWPGLGKAQIIQGDSRRIGEVVREAGIIVSSPPYVHKSYSGGLSDSFAEWREMQGRSNEKPGVSGYKENSYGSSPGNLANLKEGNVEAVIGSPPYAESLNSEKHGIKDERRARNNLDIQSAHYGTSPGQLGSMKEGEFSMICSSPPYEGSMTTEEKNNHAGGSHVTTKYQRSYGKNKNNIGNSSGDTFWAASQEIVKGCYEILKPGGKAIWVCKDYVKAGKRVPFSDRWQALCESVGFTLVCRHKALLVENHGTQGAFFGDDEEISTERKSFFRRLAEKKGSPRIDHEDVICLSK